MRDQTLKSVLGWSQSCSLWLIMLFFGAQLTVPFTISVYMVRDFGAGKYSEQLVAQLTGVLAASSSFARTFTAMLWGLASDRLGRKAVVVIGNVAILVSLMGYGTSQSFLAALLWRLLPSAFIGSPIALKAMVGEAYTEEGQAKAILIFNLGHSLGSVLGPILGGALSKPCDIYQAFPFCQPRQLLQIMPYLLPCLVTSGLGVVAVICSIVLLEESHPDIKDAPGGWWGHVLRVLSCRSSPHRGVAGKKEDDDEELLVEANGAADLEMASLRGRGEILRGSEAELGPGSPLPKDCLRDAQASADSRAMRLDSAQDLIQQGGGKHIDVSSEETNLLVQRSEDCKMETDAGSADHNYRWWKDRNVRTNIVGSGLTSFWITLSDELLPLFVSAPVDQGGLGMQLEEFTVVLCVGAIVLILFSLWLYPKLVKRYGSLTLCQAGLLCSIPCALCIPMSSLFVWSDTLKQVALILAVSARLLAVIMVASSSLILVNLFAPKASIGSINGAAMTLQSGGRALGPLLSGTLWAAAVSLDIRGQQFLAFVSIMFGYGTCFWVYRGLKQPDVA